MGRGKNFRWALAACAAVACAASAFAQGRRVVELAQGPAAPGSSAPAPSGGPDEPMFADYDCGACHTREARSIGPSYRDIAARYDATPDNVGLLASRVIDGSVGAWGDVPMTAHSDLSEAVARDLVRRILALR